MGRLFTTECTYLPTYLIRSKSAGVTGGRGRAGAGPGRDLLYGSRGVPAAPTYRQPGDLGPNEPCPSTPRVRIMD